MSLIYDPNTISISNQESNSFVGTVAQLDFYTLRHLSRGTKQIDVACPLCAPSRKKPANRARKVLRIYNSDPNFIGYICSRCGAQGYARGFVDGGDNSYNPTTERSPETTLPKANVAPYLWQRRQLIVGSLAETYLRKRRGLSCPLPATLAFLPSTNNQYPPAMIAMFGDSVDVTGIHLTRLRGDGSDKAGTDADKIMIGPSMGKPIIVAPHDDDVLIIAEGIEDALSAHQVTGCGAWAAGSASRLPALANVVPSYIKVITIVVDDDYAGNANSTKLIQKLTARDCFEVRVCTGGIKCIKT